MGDHHADILEHGRQLGEGRQLRRPIIIAVVLAVLAAASGLSWVIANPVESPQPSPAAAPRASGTPRSSIDLLVATGWHGHMNGHRYGFATEMLNPGSAAVRISAVRLTPAPGVQISAVGLADDEDIFAAFSSDEPLPPFQEISLAPGESTHVYSTMDFDCASLSPESTDELTFELDLTIGRQRLTQRLSFNDAHEGWLATLTSYDSACENPQTEPDESVFTSHDRSSAPSP